MRIVGRLKSWFKPKKRVKDEPLSTSTSGSPRPKRSQSLTDSIIPSYASRHAQFFAAGSNTQLNFPFDPTRARDDDTASEITPRDAGTTLGSRELRILTQKHSAQSIRIVPPSPRRPLAIDDPEPSPFFSEKMQSASTAMPPPLPFSALVHPKSTTTVNTTHSSSQQLSPSTTDIHAPFDSQLSPALSDQADPTPDVTPDRLADLRRASGVSGVLKMYDNAGAIASSEFDNNPPPTFGHNQSPSRVAMDDEPRSPNSPNKGRRFTNPERSNPYQSAPSPLALHHGAPRALIGTPPIPGHPARDATFGSADVSLTSSSSASILQSSSERELATSEVSTAARVNLTRLHQGKGMSKDLVNLPNATVPARNDASNIRPLARKPNPSKPIMSINVLDNEIESQERTKGGSLPSSPTWGPDHTAFPRFSTPAKAQATLYSLAPAQGDSTGAAAPVPSPHGPPGLSSSHPALTPPPKHRKAPPPRLRRPKTADDATALSPPPWRSVSSFGRNEQVPNVKDMGGGVSVVRIPAAQRVRRPATSAGIVSPKAGSEGTLSRSTRREETILEGQSQLVTSRSIPESEGSFYTRLTASRAGQESVIASTTSLVTSSLGTSTKGSNQVLTKRRSIRSRLTVPGEDESAPLRRKHSYGRSPVIRKSISDGAFPTSEKDTAEPGRKLKRFGSMRKVGTVPLKKSGDDQISTHHRRKKRSHNRPRLSFVLATDAEPGLSPRTSYLQRAASTSSLGSAVSENDDDDDAEKEGNDFTDSRSTFGKYSSGAAGSDEETTRSRKNSTASLEDKMGTTPPPRSAIDLSAELSEETKNMMAKIREKKGKKLASGLRTATHRGG
ncbi:hypothetical protein FRC04_002844 [Tulasnella sp. 424]|nr:hypothetical protein FRC04_002844 [Tulasnella sp. 424]KAG8962699.1 hypothetical protein FRC05_005155 [Tulasnella sp. 425]